jgi:hypothetical protein
MPLIRAQDLDTADPPSPSGISMSPKHPIQSAPPDPSSRNI